MTAPREPSEALHVYQVACAHLRVTYVTQTTTASLTTGWWQCLNCPTRFFPALDRPRAGEPLSADNVRIAIRALDDAKFDDARYRLEWLTESDMQDVADALNAKLRAAGART